MSESDAMRSPIVHMSDVVLPHMTNNHGTMFGGEVLAMMDKVASLAAVRFCRQPVVTASTERIDFRTPIYQGDFIDMHARVIFTGTRSMIVRIDAWAERPVSGEREWCTTGYYSMVAVGSSEQPARPVPKLLVETDAEREDWERGEEIKAGIIARTKNSRPDRPLIDPENRGRL